MMKDRSLVIWSLIVSEPRQLNLKVLKNLVLPTRNGLNDDFSMRIAYLDCISSGISATCFLGGLVRMPECLQAFRRHGRRTRISVRGWKDFGVSARNFGNQNVDVYSQGESLPRVSSPGA